jgi:hypothetical protein
MTKDEALRMALEALELNNDEWKSLADSGDCGYWNAEDQDHYKQTNEAITAIKQALAAHVQDSTCNNALREQGKAYPRTCKKCGKGPCIGLANAALDKKAENARELGLDYEPAPKQKLSVRHVSLIDEGKTSAQPAVPDAIGPNEDELPAYAAGWNDCRQTMLEILKARTA